MIHLAINRHGLRETGGGRVARFACGTSLSFAGLRSDPAASGPTHERGSLVLIQGKNQKM